MISIQCLVLKNVLQLPSGSSLVVQIKRVKKTITCFLDKMDTKKIVFFLKGICFQGEIPGSKETRAQTQQGKEAEGNTAQRPFSDSVPHLAPQGPEERRLCYGSQSWDTCTGMRRVPGNHSHTASW